jgi:uncharacterized protein
VRFRRRARLDTGQVQDRRGQSAGRGGFPVPGGAALGGGALGLIALVVALLVGGGIDLGGGTGADLPITGGDASDLSSDCQTGADANQRDDCRIVAVVNSVQDHWSESIDGYSPADTVLFEGSVDTACGSATSAVGPFYCPADEMIYIDLGFFDELERSFGARGGPFAEAYVIAHEYGHHVQNLLGTNARVGTEQGPKSGSVRLELQADCYAGVWAANAEATGLIEKLTNDDIADGLDAAGAVGDDRIQDATYGRVDPESWTHGSARQRQRWFTRGYRGGDARDCNTFAPDAL